ncbi:hypothetical protein EV44_g3859 [Erysiphe necator]|uniref:Uncharacterized protein n=1 Tax=Uncinula necator TaxID=52586 RepID=A0A0B1PEM3_UNCNE|nr:hypothetical protein EV44_g3859 [Erysiphe necator]
MLRPAKSKSSPSYGAGVNAQYALYVWDSQEDSHNPSLQDLPFITAGLNRLRFYITFPYPTGRQPLRPANKVKSNSSTSQTMAITDKRPFVRLP